jgi:glycosyl transferase family 1
MVDEQIDVISLDDLKELQIMLASVDAMSHMTDKIRVLLLSIHYPFAIKNYFERALRRRDDIDLITTGPYTGTFIPWMGGMNLPAKYAVPPEIPLPFPPNIGEVNYDLVAAQLPTGWIPDLVLTVDAGIHWKYKPQAGYVAHIATDPHVLNYDYQRTISDKFFNMQLYYSQKGDSYLPYAYDVECHRPKGQTININHFSGIEDILIEKDVDAVRIGLPYPHRVEWENKLRERGVTVLADNGPVFDEARQMYNRGKIGLNWSSSMDLNARAMELPAMKLYPVMNRVRDMAEFPRIFNSCGIFDSIDDAIYKVIWAKENPDDAMMEAEIAYQMIQGETYDARIEKILQECGFS